ncbi:hypothetical protein A9Q94_19265 [Rhodobacterales bacterium 56_14_T64]|nr:hypothetical protein A9Q94_19265 [Rhodobacterales bacterium 56_14_T64]
MSEKGEAKQLFFKNPMFWGVGATLLILLLAIVMGVSETCAPGSAGNEGCTTKWSLFLASPPNEIGDALAGFAGALAFVWIIVTVAMQSIELREQREVLTLQKEEMEMQREATEDMARSMAAQAKIFENEQKERNEIQAAREFEAHLINVQKWLVERQEEDELVHWLFDFGVYFNYGVENGALISRPSFTKYDELQEVDEFYSQLYECLKARVFEKDNDNKYEGGLETDLLLEVRNLLAELQQYESRLSRAQQLRVDTIRLSSTIEVVDKILLEPSQILTCVAVREEVK